MVRKKQVLVIGVIFFGSIFFMISQLDTSPAGNSHNETRDVKSLQEKLEAVEKQLEINKHAMNEVIFYLLFLVLLYRGGFQFFCCLKKQLMFEIKKIF